MMPYFMKKSRQVRKMDQNGEWLEIELNIFAHELALSIKQNKPTDAFLENYQQEEDAFFFSYILAARWFAEYMLMVDRLNTERHSN